MRTPLLFEQQDAPPHTMSSENVAARLNVRHSNGLTPEEAKLRLDSNGHNTLPENEARTPLLLLLAQFKNVMVLILVIAATLAAIIGNTKDAVVIGAVIVLNAIVGFYQEYRAEQSLSALKRMLPVRARVRRGGNKVEIDAEEVVPGDVVLIEAGDRVSADGRLFVSVGLSIDESSLTGESLAIQKDSDLIAPLEAPLADRKNMAFLNTIVTRGRGEFVVTATGAQTAMGKVSEQLAVADEKQSPLQIQLDKLGKRLGIVSLLMVGLLFLIQVLKGADLTREILDAIALAVASVPEGLPVVVTVTLALGMRQMARQGAIVRKMASVETLGCTTVICSDKTGTLTLNQMTVRTFYFRGQRFRVSGEGYQPVGTISVETGGDGSLPDFSLLISGLVACNDSQLRDGRVIGDPLEGALLTVAAKLGDQPAHAEQTVDRIGEVPFDSAHKFMATFRPEGPRVRVWVKGAPDVLLERCSFWSTRDGEAPLSASVKAAIHEEYRAFAGRGLRGLLVAYRVIPSPSFDPSADVIGSVRDLTFLGLIGLQDPPRPEVKDAIARCKEAGIAVMMITGDHKDTATAIARELGLTGPAVSGVEIGAMNAAELSKAIKNATVFARVAPEHKVDIVRALQASGHVVAMTGDGVNDAPALKHADIGVAMGLSGTAVSKEAASMILVDDNFATIVGAVLHGRTLYDNIVKFVRFQLSTSVGAVLTVFFAPFLGLPDPFNAIQILWVAMIMDGPPAVSLALDEPRPGIMHEVPRGRSEPILPVGRMIRVFCLGIVMTIGTLGVLRYGLNTGSESRALTLCFTTFVFFQFFNVFNARAERGTCFNRQFFANRMLWWSLTLGTLLQIAVVHWPPAQSVFRTSPLSLADWALAVGIASLILLGEEIRKWIFPSRIQRHSH